MRYKLIVCIGALGSSCVLSSDFPDFPNAKTIKSSKGNPARKHQVVEIKYPPGFKFSYDEQKERFGYLPTHETADDGKLPNTEKKSHPGVTVDEVEAAENGIVATDPQKLLDLLYTHGSAPTQNPDGQEARENRYWKNGNGDLILLE